MSQEQNIQTAKTCYADFSRGDIAAILGRLDENIEWVTPDFGVPHGGTKHGPSGVAEFFQSVHETWDFQAFEPRDYIASGDDLVVIGSYTATARATGRKSTADWAMAWKFRDGKVVRFQEFTDTAALRDAIMVGAAA